MTDNTFYYIKENKSFSVIKEISDNSKNFYSKDCVGVFESESKAIEVIGALSGRSMPEQLDLFN